MYVLKMTQKKNFQRIWQQIPDSCFNHQILSQKPGDPLSCDKYILGYLGDTQCSYARPWKGESYVTGRNHNGISN